MIVSTPRSLAAAHLHTLLQHFPGVRDGQPESVHQARVATRRLREVLPLMANGQTDRINDALAMARAIGRQLGSVRELDVMHELLWREEERVPPFAAVVAVARQALAPRRLTARRQMIKALEALDPARLPGMLSAHFGRWERLRDRYAGVAWSTLLRATIAGHAATLRGAVQHAGGVYFPNRSHSVRIAVKKLRYSVEVAEETGLWPASRLLRDLKRAQVILGELHDVHVLSEEVVNLVADSSVRPELPALLATLRAETEQRQREYLAARERLLAIADASERFAGRGMATRVWQAGRTSFVAASSLAVPAGLLLFGLSHRGRDVVRLEAANAMRPAAGRRTPEMQAGKTGETGHAATSRRNDTPDAVNTLRPAHRSATGSQRRRSAQGKRASES
jgi:CHAD domain-containing protein